MLYPQFITKKRFTDAHAGQRAANPYWTRQVKSKKVYSIAPGNAKRQAKKIQTTRIRSGGCATAANHQCHQNFRLEPSCVCRCDYSTRTRVCQNYHKCQGGVNEGNRVKGKGAEAGKWANFGMRKGDRWRLMETRESPPISTYLYSLTCSPEQRVLPQPAGWSTGW
jgi:hypothetical protein